MWAKDVVKRGVGIVVRNIVLHTTMKRQESRIRQLAILMMETVATRTQDLISPSIAVEGIAHIVRRGGESKN